MKDKYLPLGTVCMLKGGEKGLMVIGYCPQAEKDGQRVQYDYVGCIYPEGIVSSDQNLVFNHDQIEKIIKEVEVEPETEDFLKKLRALMFAIESGAVDIDQVMQGLEKAVNEPKDNNSNDNNTGNTGDNTSGTSDIAS